MVARAGGAGLVRRHGAVRRTANAPALKLLLEQRVILESFERVQFIPADIGRVWPFFSDPRNLNALTPPGMGFQILSDPSRTMYAGMLIEYSVRLGWGIRTRWLTEIRQVREGSYFCDEQRVGPYHLWYHEHHYEVVEAGVQMTDRVTYALGYGPLGWLLNRLWIRAKLKTIFDYRSRKIEELFPARAG
jgi:ligand-binding SRPBCC domain-containing protein